MSALDQPLISVAVRPGPRRERHRMTVVAVTLGLGLLAGCGGQDSASTSSTSAPSGPVGTASEDPADNAGLVETGSVATASLGAPASDAVAPSAAQDNADTPYLITWDVAGKYLLVTTFGSSGCPNAVLRVAQTDEQQLELSSTNSEALLLGTAPKSCTADYAPFTSSVVVPAGIVRTEPLTVIIDGNEIEVPAAP